MNYIQHLKIYKPITQKRTDYIKRYIFIDIANTLVIKDLGTCEREHFYYWEGGMKMGVISKVELRDKWVEIKIDGDSEIADHDRFSHDEVITSYGVLKNGDRVKNLKCSKAPEEDDSLERRKASCNWTGQYIYKKGKVENENN